MILLLRERPEPVTTYRGDEWYALRLEERPCTPHYAVTRRCSTGVEYLMRSGCFGAWDRRGVRATTDWHDAQQLARELGANVQPLWCKP